MPEPGLDRGEAGGVVRDPYILSSMFLFFIIQKKIQYLIPPSRPPPPSRHTPSRHTRVPSPGFQAPRGDASPKVQRSLWSSRVSLWSAWGQPMVSLGAAYGQPMVRLSPPARGRPPEGLLTPKEPFHRTMLGGGAGGDHREERADHRVTIGKHKQTIG